MREANFDRGRCLLFRLDHGEDIICQISRMSANERIDTGVLSAIGALDGAVLGYYDQRLHRYEDIRLEGQFELVSCSGNISLRDGKTFVHAHAVLADRQGRAFGGHLMSAVVFAAEVFIQELLGRPLCRIDDPITGLKLWE